MYMLRRQNYFNLNVCVYPIHRRKTNKQTHEYANMSALTKKQLLSNNHFLAHAWKQ